MSLFYVFFGGGARYVTLQGPELATGTIPMTKHLPYMTPQIRDEVGDSGHMQWSIDVFYARLLAEYSMQGYLGSCRMCSFLASHRPKKWREWFPLWEFSLLFLFISFFNLPGRGKGVIINAQFPGNSSFRFCTRKGLSSLVLFAEKAGIFDKIFGLRKASVKSLLFPSHICTKTT